MQSAAVVLDFTRDEIFTLQSETVQGDGISHIEIRGRYGNAHEPQILIEPKLDPDDPGKTATRLIGDDSYVRAYYFGEVPDGIESYVTDGSILYQGAHSEEIAELVVIQNGSGNTSRPIADMSTASWLGDDGGAITPAIADTVLSAQVSWGIVRITYQSVYHLWRVSGTGVEKVLGVLSADAARGIAVRVATDNDAPVYAEGVSDELLTSEAAAVERGMAEIDRHKYDREIVSLQVPFYPALEDGILIMLSDSVARVSGVYHVEVVAINFDGVAITADVKVEKCLLN